MGRIKHHHNDDDDNENKNDKRCYGLHHTLFLALHGLKGVDSADPYVDLATLYSVGCFLLFLLEMTHDRWWPRKFHVLNE